MSANDPKVCQTFIHFSYNPKLKPIISIYNTDICFDTVLTLKEWLLRNHINKLSVLSVFYLLSYL